MRLIEKMAKEWAENIGRGSFRCSQHMYECIDQREAGFEAGFCAAREMGVSVAENHPNEPEHKPYGFCNTCGGGPAIADQIKDIGENEVE